MYRDITMQLFLQLIYTTKNIAKIKMCPKLIFISLFQYLIRNIIELSSKTLGGWIAS
jgi:hypothetical protein